MPVDPNAPIEVTAYKAVPDFARGRIKDIRVRWALEEIGAAYRTRLIGDIFQEKPASYLTDQPFGQVPVLKEGDVTLFESGAILIYLGERDTRLLPSDASAKGRAIAWLIAALNSVEPPIQTLVTMHIAGQGQDWQDGAKAAAMPFAQKQMARLSHWLGDRDWLEEQFSIGDLVMIDVLRNASPILLQPHPNLASYVERGTSRPAFQRAMEAHLKDCAVE